MKEGKHLKDLVKYHEEHPMELMRIARKVVEDTIFNKEIKEEKEYKKWIEFLKKDLAEGCGMTVEELFGKIK